MGDHEESSTRSMYDKGEEKGEESSHRKSTSSRRRTTTTNTSRRGTSKSVHSHWSDEVEPNLPSDFCLVEDEDFIEHNGEQIWVCRDSGEIPEFYGEAMLYPEGFGPDEEEEEELSKEEREVLDSEYLKRVLGTPLTFALLEISKKRPTDPIQFLGHYLLKWRWSGEDKSQYEETIRELNREREAYLEKIKEQQRQKMLIQEQNQEILRRMDKEESSIESSLYGEEGQYIPDEKTNT